MSRVVITGGAGFIGYHLARRLILDGNQVVLVDNFSRGNLDQGLRTLLEHSECSILDVNLVQEALPDIDTSVVVHLAAIVGVDNVTANPYAVLDKNTRALLQVLAWSATRPNLEHFLFTSTSEVYAGSVELALCPVPTPEESVLAVKNPRDARSSYLLSKIYGEALCAHSELPHTVVRPHNVYGPRMGMNHVIPQLLLKAWKAPSDGVLEVSSIAHTRTFLYVDDAVAHLSKIVSSPAEGNVLNLGNQGPEISIAELAETVIKAVGKNLTVAETPPTPGSPPRRAPDTSAFRKIYGDVSPVSLKEGVARTLDWYRKNDVRFQGGANG